MLSKLIGLAAVAGALWLFLDDEEPESEPATPPAEPEPS
jgi:hypothetical protein